MYNACTSFPVSHLLYSHHPSRSFCAYTLSKHVFLLVYMPRIRRLRSAGYPTRIVAMLYIIYIRKRQIYYPQINRISIRTRMYTPKYTKYTRVSIPSDPRSKYCDISVHGMREGGQMLCPPGTFADKLIPSIQQHITYLYRLTLPSRRRHFGGWRRRRTW